MNIQPGRARTAGDGCSAGKSGDVLSVDVAAEQAFRAAPSIRSSEILPVLAASERIAASAILCAVNIPPFDNSAMDGYAVSTGSFEGSGPWTLKIRERIVAGTTPKRSLETGTAARIMTGAPIPQGADTVIMQEYCERTGGEVVVAERPERAKHIRRAGEDVGAGSEIVAAGELLTPRHVALLAAAGIAAVDVVRKVRIGLISTGSELVEPGWPLSPGQIYNSNRYYLRSRLQRPWIETRDYGIVGDDAAHIRALVARAARECDIVISTGGVSAGEEDHMLDVLEIEAADLKVLKVAMRPGKPVTVGRLGSALFVGLPGNPYAAAITFMKIAWPAIRAAAGMTALQDNTIEAVSGFNLRRKTGRREYVPVSWSTRDEFGRPVVVALGRGASASLHPFAQARAIAVLPAEMAEVRLGDRLQLEPVDY
ncbi:MAG: molybdopterin molybdotransferase MoeA [Notoacmeibacter sp.]|nr:molybdopterin molybdotransferase MoeA [Notoacmeibacter sp.]